MFKRVFKLPVLLGAALLATAVPAVQSHATPDTPPVDDGLKVTVVGADEIGVYTGDLVYKLTGTSVTLQVKNCYLTDPAVATRDQRVDIKFQQSAYYSDNVNRHSIGIVHNQVMHLYKGTTTNESGLKGGLNHFDVTVTLQPGLYTGSVYCHDAGDQSRSWQQYFYVPEGSLDIHGVGGGIWKLGEEAVISSEKGIGYDGKTFGVLASNLKEEKRHPASVSLIYPDGREEKLGDFKPDDKGHLELPKRMLPSEDAGIYTIKAVQNWVEPEPDLGYDTWTTTKYPDKPKVESMPITLTAHYYVAGDTDPGENPVPPKEDPKDDPKDKPAKEQPAKEKPKTDKPKRSLPKTGW